MTLYALRAFLICRKAARRESRRSTSLCGQWAMQIAFASIMKALRNEGSTLQVQIAAPEGI
jgi:hypothetical protein